MPGQPMEEILASIKRIIAEDAPLSLGPPTLGGNGAPKPYAVADYAPEEDVLELEAPTPPPLAEPIPVSAPAPEVDPAPVVEQRHDDPDPAFTVHEQPAPALHEAISAAIPPDYVFSGPALATPEPEPAVPPATPTPVARDPEPAPEPKAKAMLDAAVLAAALDPEPAYESLLSASAEAASRQALAALNTLTIDARAAPNTLDGLVREMLRPMVKDWLDKNLPSLVEQLVAKEIKRLGRG
jgi:cell pole-organizing protein PopZ